MFNFKEKYTKVDSLGRTHNLSVNDLAHEFYNFEDVAHEKPNIDIIISKINNIKDNKDECFEWAEKLMLTTLTK